MNDRQSTPNHELRRKPAFFIMVPYYNLKQNVVFYILTCIALDIYSVSNRPMQLGIMVSHVC